MFGSRLHAFRSGHPSSNTSVRWMRVSMACYAWLRIHAEIIVKELGLEDAKGGDTPGVKENEEE